MTDTTKSLIGSKIAHVLLWLRDRPGTIRDIRRGVDLASSYGSRLVNELQDEGLVDVEKRNRSKLVKLSKRGRYIADNLHAIKKAL